MTKIKTAVTTLMYLRALAELEEAKKEMAKLQDEARELKAFNDECCEAVRLIKASNDFYIGLLTGGTMTADGPEGGYNA